MSSDAGGADRFSQLAASLSSARAQRRIANPRPARGGRRAAVLILLSRTDPIDLVFTERGSGLRKHAGQISFPGGGVDATDASPVAAALRETQEEIGLHPGQVEVLGDLPAAFVAASGFDVTSVVATWDGQARLQPHSEFEVARVHRFGIPELASTTHRITARHPNGYRGPGFVFGDVFIWGFTAHLVDALLHLAGWEEPWDASREVEVPHRFRRDRISADHD